MNLLLSELALAVSLITQAQVDVDPGELTCLARNVYYEARGEDRAGQTAVAYLTLNRVESHRFPDTICGVVTEDRGPQKWDCQFSWWCDGKSDYPNDKDAYQKAILIALDAMTGESVNPVPGATHYYAPSSAGKAPGWSLVFAEIAVIGGHRFMQE